MKSLIAYYSYSGNTKKVAEILKDTLSKKGEVKLLQLKPIDEQTSFFAQAQAAFFRKRARLLDINFDLTDYELICIGTPVWAFAPTPAINTFLDKIKNLDKKSAICFTTYASGAGVKRCVSIIKNTLKEKGASRISDFNIQQFKVDDTSFVEEQIKNALTTIDIYF